MTGQVDLKQGHGLRRRAVIVTDWFRLLGFRPAARDVHELSPSGWLCSQTSAGRFDAVITVASPSVELRSWLHGGSRGRRQRTPEPAYDQFHHTEDILGHVILAFLQ